MALAIVPGGVAVDPWTGAPLPLGGFVAADGAGVDVTGGAAIHVSGSGAGGTGGCQSWPSGAPASPALALLVALPFVAVMLRRRLGREGGQA